MDKLLEQILTTKRAHNSPGELGFLKWLHDYIKKLGHDPVAMAEGCIVVKAGVSKVLFSCHVDTVHQTSVSQGEPQALFFDAAMGHVFLADPKEGCLGADDGAGIYMLLNMLEAKVPGTYVFHRGEEKGGIGSNAMLAKHKEWFKQFDQCVAFDRAGTQDIVISQGGQVCGSPAYANSLAALLLPHGLDYKISHGGTFTDSKVYRYIIPECINLSVGYDQQHTPKEYQDFEHLIKLRDAAIAIDWSTLTIARKPESEPVAYLGSGRGRYDRSYGAYDDYQDYAGFGFSPERGPERGSERGPVKGFTSFAAAVADVKKKNKNKVTSLPTKLVPPVPPAKTRASEGTVEDLEYMNYEEIYDWANDSALTDAISALLVKNAELEARAAVYKQLLGM